MDISSSEIYQKTIIFDVLIGVNVGVLHRVLWAYPAFQVLLQFQDPQFHHQVLLNFLWGVYMAANWICIFNTRVIQDADPMLIMMMVFR